MKLDKNFSKISQQLVDETLKEMMIKNPEIMSDNITYLNKKMYIVAFTLISLYHNKLADTLKEKGIDIGYLDE